MSYNEFNSSFNDDELTVYDTRPIVTKVVEEDSDYLVTHPGKYNGMTDSEILKTIRQVDDVEDTCIMPLLPIEE